MQKNQRVEYSESDIKFLIDEGAEICKKLKQIYPHKGWPAITNLFTGFKVTMRKFYSTTSDVELLRLLGKYSPQDIQDSLEGSGKTPSVGH